MADKKAPLFRNSMHGYNREDVNSYIISINRSMEENRKNYEKALEECNERAKADSGRITELTEKAESLERENELLLQRIHKLEEAERLSVIKEEELVSLRLQVAELEDKLSSREQEENGEETRRYESLCAKAGEILVIASSTAEDILSRANTEALKIVGDANSKKDLMLRTFSESVDEAAGDINSYIRSAVDACVQKINRSVREVSEMASPTNEKKPKVSFVGNGGQKK
ncbi:MAG: hypothetical protein IJD22_01320 [Clostridia bacterium]|nr:hypothetical protein [Clostridia bacterium]